MEGFKKTSNLSENKEKTDSEISKKRKKSMFNDYQPKVGFVEVTADTHKVKIKVQLVSPFHKHILYIDGQPFPNQSDYELAKSGIYKIEASFINPLNGTETKLKKVKKSHEIIDPITNLKIVNFEFFNDDITHPWIIIEMSDTP